MAMMKMVVTKAVTSNVVCLTIGSSSSVHVVVVVVDVTTGA